MLFCCPSVHLVQFVYLVSRRVVLQYGWDFVDVSLGGEDGQSSRHSRERGIERETIRRQILPDSAPLSPPSPRSSMARIFGYEKSHLRDKWGRNMILHHWQHSRVQYRTVQDRSTWLCFHCRSYSNCGPRVTCSPDTFQSVVNHKCITLVELLAFDYPVTCPSKSHFSYFHITFICSMFCSWLLFTQKVFGPP